MKKKILAGVTGAALTIGVGLGLAQPAQAETPTPTSTPTTAASASASPSDSPLKDRPDVHGHGRSSANLSGLATALGMDEETVSDALVTVRDQLRSQTPAADETHETRRAAMASALAAELDVEESVVSEALAELQAERRDTRVLDEEGVLDSAVSDGTLTRTEADAVQKALDAGIVSTRGGGQGRR